MDKFDIKGLDQFGDLSIKLKTDVTNQINLANKTAVNKSIDIVAYGKSTGISANNVSGKGIVAKAAKALRIPIEHIYYRTFTAGIKVTRGRQGRSIKPYASLMIRGSAINVGDLLVKGSAAKNMYGYQTRKKKIGSKTKPNMKGLAASARTKSGVNINGRVYGDTVIADGSYRNSKSSINDYYMQKLGAKSKQLAGKRMMVLRRKNKGQSLPYPVEAVQIKSSRVMSALNAAARNEVPVAQKTLDQLQKREVKRRLKKLGFELK